MKILRALGFFCVLVFLLVACASLFGCDMPDNNQPVLIKWNPKAHGYYDYIKFAEANRE